MTAASSSGRRSLVIMGIRGVPAAHGGFETFAARLAPWLVEHGWDVTVYCEEPVRTAAPYESEWHGVRRVHIGFGPDRAINSIRFDWACIDHFLAERPRKPLVLTLGYNTALFCLRLRAAGVTHVINMDGIEWARSKWGPIAKAWLYLNDWGGCLGASHLLADHPEIARHLASRVDARRISMIPYGTDLVDHADPMPLAALGLEPGGFFSLIARPEPENSVLEIVRAFSARRRGLKLVVLGRYRPEHHPYHDAVMKAASDEVMFAGAIYDAEVLAALRQHSLAYLHGHRVGGTNPSLLEAMGAGNAVVAHGNRFNRWVAQDGALYFTDAASCAAAIDRLVDDPALGARMGRANRARAEARFGWPLVLSQYEMTMAALHARAMGVVDAPAPPLAGHKDAMTEMDPT
jgi:glycosyltransferase involved in cell wall biosynthesis